MQKGTPNFCHVYMGNACIYIYTLLLHSAYTMWTNEGLKRVIARKDVPFAGVNDNLQ